MSISYQQLLQEARNRPKTKAVKLDAFSQPISVARLDVDDVPPKDHEATNGDFLAQVVVAGCVTANGEPLFADLAALEAIDLGAGELLELANEILAFSGIENDTELAGNSEPTDVSA